MNRNISTDRNNGSDHISRDQAPLIDPSGFNPFRPTQHDYETLLRDVLRDLLSPHIQAAT